MIPSVCVPVLLWARCLKITEITLFMSYHYKFYVVDMWPTILFLKEKTQTFILPITLYNGITNQFIVTLSDRLNIILLTKSTAYIIKRYFFFLLKIRVIFTPFPLMVCFCSVSDRYKKSKYLWLDDRKSKDFDHTEIS